MTAASNRARTSSVRPYSYRFVCGVAVTLVVAATVVYRVLEDWSWLDSFYFTVTAVTTVGFGDLTATTNLTKIFTVAYILAVFRLSASCYKNGSVATTTRLHGSSSTPATTGPPSPGRLRSGATTTVAMAPATTTTNSTGKLEDWKMRGSDDSTARLRHATLVTGRP